MTIDEAFNYFSKQVQSFEFSQLGEDNDSREKARRILWIKHNNSALRLIFNGQDRNLALEITHGSPGNEIYGKGVVLLIPLKSTLTIQ
jgi:hypothetical protein